MKRGAALAQRGTLTLVSTFVFALLAGRADADATRTLTDVFATANRAAWARDWDGAARGYDELVRGGVEDADVYYNLATVHLQAGRLGQAIRFYERTLRLRPADEDARHNLEQARRQLGRRLAGHSLESRLTPGRAVLARFTREGAAWSFLAIWIALWTLVLVRPALASDHRRLVSGVVLPIVLGLAVLSGGVLAGKLYYERRGREAIVVATDRATGKTGPGSEYPDALQVAEGARVQVLAREGRWTHVRLGDGREGWLKRADVGTL